MRTRTIIRVGPFASGLLFFLPLFAQATELPATWTERGVVRPATIADSAKKFEYITPQPAAASRILIETSAPIYTPPQRGTTASTLRVGGGTRGNATLLPTISVLAPNGDGTTIHDRPTLYWHTSRPLAAPVLLTLIEVDAVAPTAVIRLVSPSEPGFHAIRFAELGIRLAPGTTYHWSVAVVTDAARRSHDLVATGAIEFVPNAAGESEPGLDYPAFARLGLWYDAVAALSERLNTDPSDAMLQSHRAALLDAVGLGIAAGDDRHRGL